MYTLQNLTSQASNSYDSVYELSYILNLCPLAVADQNFSLGAKQPQYVSFPLELPKR